MARIPDRFNHLLFGVMQSGLTCSVATAISVLPQGYGGPTVVLWLKSWLIAWIIVLPVVILAAPILKRLAGWLTTAAS